MNSHSPLGDGHPALPIFSLGAVWATVLGGPPSLVVREVDSKKKNHLLIELASLFVVWFNRDYFRIQQFPCDFVLGRLILPPGSRNYSFPSFLIFGRETNRDCGSKWHRWADRLPMRTTRERFPLSHWAVSEGSSSLRKTAFEVLGKGTILQ